MEIIMIAAKAKNNVIGKAGKIPWHISEDFKHFKEKTMGYPVIMGMTTFESLPVKPLSGRTNIVLTKNPEYHPENVVVKYSMKDALDYCNGAEKIFLIGGASIYKQGMEFADTLELTEIDREYEGDTYFPEFSMSEWELVNSDPRDGYSFNTYKRKN
ncbi:MAG TPA: dihydrofolate reductase [Candidatus Woesearchaeota archaeon]|nr:dihydrofolate reductase [Candidatus Woesearchaeota archaeon]